MPRAVSLADKLLNQHKNALAEVALVPSQGGAFEVIVGGEKVYSKLQTGRFPSEGEVLKSVAGKL